MKITEIRIDRTKNTGQYENIKLGFTAVVGDDENTVEAIERVKKLLDWEINKEERDANRKRYLAQLEHINALDEAAQADEKYGKEKTRIENWLAAYDSRQSEIEALA